MIYINTREYANIENISERAVRKRIKDGKIENYQKENGGFKIAICELSAEGVFEYYNRKYNTLAKTKRVLLKNDSDIPHDDKKIKVIKRKLRIVQTAEHPPSDYKKTDWVKEVAEKENVAVTTIYNWRKKYKKNTLDALIRKTRKDAGKVKSFSKEAKEALFAFYFGQKRISIKKAYYKMMKACVRNGWEYGSYRTAFRLINEHPEKKALETYRDEGRWGLKNKIARPILRKYEDMSVNECWCGDQHVFNWFVFDSESGVVFRPTGFCWLDMRSRRAMGFAAGRTYNKNTVALALLDGILPEEHGMCGIPEMIYTDWGKPEMSNFLQGLDLLGVKPIKENKKFEKMLKDMMPESKGLYDHLNIKSRQAIVRNPQAKPIERWFATLERKLLDKGLPGWAGNKAGSLTDKDQQELKKQRKNGQLVSFEQFFEIVLDTIQDYNNDEHRGKDMQGFTPNDIWDIQLRKGFTPEIIDKRSAQLIILPRTERIVQRDGIHFDNNIYTNEKLSDIIGAKVEIAVDPYHDHKAIIFHKGEWFCDAEEYDFVNFNAEPEEVAEAKEIQNSQVKKYIKHYKQIVKKKPEDIELEDIQMKQRQLKVDESAKKREQMKKIEKDINKMINKTGLNTDDVWNMLENRDKRLKN